jgi:hypothetical protein
MNGNEHQDAHEDNKDIREREIKPRDRRDPLAQIIYNGQLVSREEAKELSRRDEIRVETHWQQLREEWVASPGGKLCMAFFEAFQAYRTYLAENPQAYRLASGRDGKYEEHKVFEQSLRVMADYKHERDEVLRRNLEKAQRAARCQHLFMNGEQCGSPRVRGRKLCYMHERIEETKADKLDLGPIEDPDSIQVAIRKLQGAIIEGKLDHWQVGQLAYTIQLAAWNVTRMSTVMREE